MAEYKMCQENVRISSIRNKINANKQMRRKKTQKTHEKKRNVNAFNEQPTLRR